MVAIVINSDYFFDRMIEVGATRYAHERANSRWSQLITIPNGMARKGFLRDYRPEGVIAAVGGLVIEEELACSGIPVVNTYDHIPNPRLPTIRIDDLKVGKMAADHFLERGFYHFAFCGAVRNRSYSLARAKGFSEAVRSAGYQVDLWYLTRSTPLPQGADWNRRIDSLAQWMLSLPKPVAIFASEDRMGDIVHETAQRARLSIPEQVAIVGVDNDPVRHHFNSGLSSIELPVSQVGYAAAAMLDDLLDRRVPANPHPCFPPVGVVIRASSDTRAISDPDVLEALRFIRNNAQRMIDVDTVADAVAMSRRSLHRRFKEVMGITPGDEIRRVCMAHACGLLASTILGVDEIAGMIGFHSRSQFFASFRRTVGMTPAQYRARHRPH